MQKLSRAKKLGILSGISFLSIPVYFLVVHIVGFLYLLFLVAGAISYNFYTEALTIGFSLLGLMFYQLGKQKNIHFKIDGFKIGFIIGSLIGSGFGYIWTVPFGLQVWGVLIGLFIVGIIVSIICSLVASLIDNEI